MPVHVPADFPLVRNNQVIAFIGEAPSDEEVQQEHPLVGPSGRVFNAMLRTAGIDRARHFVTNVFDEQLPDNDVKNWCEVRSPVEGDLPPLGKLGYLRPEFHHHLERLRHELLQSKANVVVPLGGTALWALTGDTRISGVRGTVLAASRVVPGAKLLPTFHPSAVIHQWKLFSIVTGDFIKATREAEYPQIELPRRELWIEPTLDDLTLWTPRLLASDLLSVDIETGWGQITNIGFAPSQYEALNVPFLDKRKPDRNYWGSVQEEVEAWGFVKRVMESDTPKLGQNFGGYDAMWLIKSKDIHPRNFLHDTRLMHHALYPELDKSLEFMASSYSKQGAWKHWGKKAQKTKRDD